MRVGAPVFSVLLYAVAASAGSRTIHKTYDLSPVVPLLKEGVCSSVRGDRIAKHGDQNNEVPVFFSFLALQPGECVTSLDVQYEWAEGGSPSHRQPDITVRPSRILSLSRSVFGEGGGSTRCRFIGVQRKFGVPIAVFLLAAAPEEFQAGGEALPRRIFLEVVAAAGQTEGQRFPAHLLPQDLRELAVLVDNPEDLPPSRYTKAGDIPAAAVICPPEFTGAAARLQAANETAGLPTRVVTTDWIAANFEGRRPDGGADLQTAIRDFIRFAFEQENLRFVLLLGDADYDQTPFVPVRYLQTTTYPAPIPSDVYYGCLDGTFDADADGIYGEDEDGEGGGPVDLLFEVHVGRVPADSVQEAEAFVDKLVSYRNTGGEKLRRVLLAGERVGWGVAQWGGDLLDHILAGSDENGYVTSGFADTPAGAFYEVTTLYDRGYPSGGWSPEEIVRRINEGIHLIAHVGHGTLRSVMRIDEQVRARLTNEPGFIAYSEVCDAGAFDNRNTAGEISPQDSIVESLLTSPHGAVGFIANTRFGWVDPNIRGGPSHRFHRFFWDRLLAGGVLELGAASDAAKEMNAGYAAVDPKARWCFYALEVFGDPSLVVKRGSSEAILALDRPYYLPGSEARIVLIDTDLDSDPLSPDTAQVVIRSAETGDSATVVLTESGPRDGVFTGTVQLAPELCPIGFRYPDTLEVLYRDEDNGRGESVERTVSRPVVEKLSAALPGEIELETGRPVEIPIDLQGGVGPFTIEVVENYTVEPGEPCPTGSAEPTGWHADDAYWRVSLVETVRLFPFSFWGNVYDQVAVSSNGFLEFGHVEAGHNEASVESLKNHKRIAVVWRDLTSVGNAGIYIIRGEDYFGFWWMGLEDYQSKVRVDARVVLFPDGRICISRDNAGGSLCGISAGDGINYIVVDDIAELAGRKHLLFTPVGLPRRLTCNTEEASLSGIIETAGLFYVLIKIRDAAGQVSETECTLHVAPNRITVENPEAGEYLYEGQEYEIKWISTETEGFCSLWYNLDGSLSEFPLEIAKEVPVAQGRFIWNVPRRRASQCRIAIRDPERDIFAVSPLFRIVGPTIVVESPREGDVWIAGERVEVRWRNLGYTGDTVLISYNTAGSEDDFPGVLQAAVPNSGSAFITVPYSPSPSCRLCIAVEENPAVRGVSAVFSIELPSFSITSPGERACFKAGGTERVEWTSKGDTGPSVYIKYNLTGEIDSFPLLATPVPVSNTGSFEFQVPDTSAPFCRLMLQSSTDFRLKAISPVFRISPDCHNAVLFWIPFIEQDEEEVQGAIRALNEIRPDLEISFSTAVDAAELEAALTDVHGMLVLQQEHYEQLSPDGVDFRALGSSLSKVLEEFVLSGGALVVCRQWREAENFLSATGLMKTEFLGVSQDIPCEVIDPQDPLVRRLPFTFNGPASTAWYRFEGPGVKRLVGYKEYTVVASRDLGFGRIVLLGFDYYERNEATSNLLVNSLLVPAVRAGLRIFRPDLRGPGTPAALGPGDRVRFGWVVKGFEGGNYIIGYNVDGSDTLFPHSELVQASDSLGEWTWEAPDPGPEDFFSCRFRIQAEGREDLADVTPSPILVRRPLAIETIDVPECSLDYAYKAELRITGGVPPFSVERIEGLPVGLGVSLKGTRSVLIEGIPTGNPGTYEIELSIADSLQQSAHAGFSLEVIKRAITLASPEGGEHLPVGGQLFVRWEARGYLGDTVSISYNTDGSPDTFPFVLAEEWPIGEPYAWALPEEEIPKCRLCVSSTLFPAFKAVSGVFSIKRPGVYLLSPTGYRCVTRGGIAEIRWSSVLNSSGLVDIACNTDGSEDRFPITIASGAPDTGIFEWHIPERLFEEAPDAEIRICVCFAGGALCGVSAGTFGLAERCGARVLFCGIYSDSTALDSAIRALRRSGIQVSWEAASGVPTAADLASASCMVFLPESPDSLGDPELDADKLENAGVYSFVRAGGALVALLPGSRTLLCLQRAGLLQESVSPKEDISSREIEVVALLHPIVEGIPRRFGVSGRLSSFSFGGEGFKVLSACAGAPVAAVKQLGSGWIVLLGWGAEENAVCDRILANSLEPRAASPGVAFVEPEPGDVFFSGEPINISYVSQGIEGSVTIRYNLDGSETYPFELTTRPIEGQAGEVLWSDPPEPPAGGLYSLRLLIEAGEASGIRSAMEGPCFIVHPLELPDAALPEAVEQTPYRYTIRAKGGKPPYTYAVSGLPEGLSWHVAGDTLVFEGRSAPGSATYQVLVLVKDDAGLEAERTYVVAVRPPRISFLNPLPGSTFVQGQEVEIEWQADGEIGRVVQIAYNLDGSLSDFPYRIADSVPADCPFPWRIPEVESSSCRLRIKGVGAYSHLHAVSDVFLISAPKIILFQPRENACLCPGRVYPVRWKSIGNTSGVVTIRGAFDLDWNMFPLILAEEIPDSGLFLWKVPETNARSGRILITDGQGRLRSSSPRFRISCDCPLRVVLWVPFLRDSQNELWSTIAALLLYEPDLRWSLSEALDPSALQSDLAGADSLIVCEQEQAGDTDFARLGRTLGPVLRDFVACGNTLVVCKQKGRAGEFLRATGLMSCSQVGQYFNLELRVAEPNHPLSEGLPPRFETKATTCWFECEDQEVRVIITSGLGDVVLVKDIERGRIVLIGCDYSHYTDASARLLANAVRMIPVRRRTRFVRGDANGDAEVDLADALHIASYLFAGGPRPPCLDAADVNDSARRRGPPGVGLDDVLYLLRFLFAHGDPPPPPSPSPGWVTRKDCGVDPQWDDGLDCSSYPFCE